MENNALHYKMYKAKKNIVYAGLLTTAALAGLTFANVNNTANAATVNQPVATTQAANAAATPATSAQISSASQNVVKTSAAASNANVALSQAQSNYDSAAQLNSGVTAVNSAQQAYSDASNAVNSAKAAKSRAALNLTSASTSYENASNAAQYGENVGGHTLGGSAAASAAQSAVNSLNDQLQIVQGNLSSDEAQLASATSAYNAKSAELATLKDQLGTNINNWQEKVKAATDATNQAAYDMAHAHNHTERVAAQQRYNIASGQLTAAKAGLKSAQDSYGTYIANVLVPLDNAVTHYQHKVYNDNNSVHTTGNVDYSQWGHFNGIKTLQSQLKNEQAVIDYQNGLVQKANEAKAKLDAAQTAYNVASQDLQNAYTARSEADEEVTNVRQQYDLLNNKQMQKLRNDLSNQKNIALPNAQQALKNDAQYQHHYVPASNAVANAQKAVDQAQTAANSASQSLANLETAVEKDQAAVDAATNENDKATAESQLANDKALRDAAKSTKAVNDTALANAQSDLAEANKNLARAITPELQVKLDNYNNAKATIKKLEAQLDAAVKAQEAAANATSTVAAAQAALNTAKANAAMAQRDYDAAVNYYNSLISGAPVTETLAQKYAGNLVSGGTVIYTMPTQNANSTKSGLAAATPEGADAVVAVVPAPTASQVTNTEEAANNVKSVAWTDPAQVNADAKVVGNHAEDVTITFNDGSVAHVNWNLLVQAAGNQGGNPGNQGGNSGNQGGNSGNQGGNSGNQGGNTSKNGGSKTTVKGNGSTVKGNGSVAVNNGTAATTNNAANTSVALGHGTEAVLPTASATKTVANNAANTSAANTNTNAASLPQTGNENTGAVVALGAISAMFGLGLAAKKREF